MTDRSHPDHIEGYEDRWYRRRHKPSASAEYEAGWAGAEEVAAMYRRLGLVQGADGVWRKPDEMASER